MYFVTLSICFYGAPDFIEYIGAFLCRRLLVTYERLNWWAVRSVEKCYSLRIVQKYWIIKCKKSSLQTCSEHLKNSIDALARICKDVWRQNVQPYSKQRKNSFGKKLWDYFESTHHISNKGGSGTDDVLNRFNILSHNDDWNILETKD